MQIATALKVSLAAVVLASSFAMPAAAHGDMRRTVLYYQDPGAAPIGGEITYCDGHFRIWGDIGDPSYTTVTDEYICP